MAPTLTRDKRARRLDRHRARSVTGAPGEPSWDQIEQLFFRALEQRPGERAAFLASSTDDLALQEEVRTMLASQDEPGLAIERLLPEAPAPGQPLQAPALQTSELLTPLAGRRIGPYRVTKLLGRGGMGEVYLAERDDAQFHRKVAIKLMGVADRKASADLLRRFDLERRVLAQLQHSGIAQLLDAGSMDDGRPFLVMEYVDGQPITDYCDHHRLGVDERLELFRTVCDVVQFAHTRLVIHRDLKPGNIMVVEREAGKPEVKLLDFGIAKLIEPARLDISALETRTSARPMTPLFAAPEQYAGEPLTTATDVYSLGVLYYLLMTGSPPFERSGSAADYERLVRTGTPRRLAEILTQEWTTAATASAVSHRDTTRDRLRRLLEGDLERIGAMALHIDVSRRYASAGQFGEDIARFQRGEAVLAQPDTWNYRLRVLLRRNRLAVVVAAAVLVSLSVLSGFLAVQTGRAQRALATATAQTERSERVVSALVGLFGTADPRAGAVGDEIPVSEFLARVEAAVDSLQEDPELQTQLFGILGRIHAGRNEGERAVAFLERAASARRIAGAEPSEQLQLDHAVARATIAVDGVRGAELLRASVENHRRHYGVRDPLTALVEVDFVAALEPTESLPLLDGALLVLEGAFGDDSIEVARALDQRAEARKWAGMVAAARTDIERALPILQRSLGGDHPETLDALHVFSTLLPRTESLPVLRDLIERQERVFGRDSAAVARSFNTVGEHLARMGEIDEALEAFRRSVGLLRSLYGEGSRATVNSARNLAMLTGLAGGYREATELFEGLRSNLPVDERNQSYIEIQIAYMNGRAGGPLDLSASIDTTEKRVSALDRIRVGGDDPYPSRARAMLIKLLLAHGRFPRALEVAETALFDATGSMPAEHPIVIELSFLRARAAYGLAPGSAADLRKQLARFEALPLHERVEVALARRQLVGR